MSSSLAARQLERFNQQIDLLKNVFQVSEEAPYVYILTPENPKISVLNNRPVPLSLFAITHGNETAGLGILNDFLYQLISRPELLEFPLGIALGNPEAALAGKRYLDRDLNRSFGFSDRSLKEPARTEVLESLLKKSWYFIDFHQTRKKNTEPFFIFPYNKKSYEFARTLAPEIPLVTHWSGGFSKEGSCSDEFHNKNGGVGITIETGQNGLDPYQTGYGFFIILRALEVLRRESGLSHPLAEKAPLQSRGPVYTWAATKVCHPDDKALLDEGWYNFRDVSKGEKMGHSKTGDINAEASGKVLFPKYPDPDVVAPAGPSELYRIIKEISETELPSD